MKRKPERTRHEGPPPWTPMLKARLLQNAAATILETGRDGALTLGIPAKKPAWHIPPVSWVVPIPEQKILKLDGLGSRIWSACDGHRTVEEIILFFACDNVLTFHESRVSVTTYAQMLLKRGALAVAMEQNPGSVRKASS